MDTCSLDLSVLRFRWCGHSWNSTTHGKTQFVSGLRCVAPSNGTSWYQNPCITSALAKGAASTALDAVGLLPEGGAVSAAFSLFHGAAGVSNGTNILGRVQFGAALIGTANAGSDASGDGGALAGAQTFTGLASIRSRKMRACARCAPDQPAMPWTA